MKKLIPLLLLISLFFSCQEKARQGFSLDGLQVVLEQYSDFEMISSDTLTVENMQLIVDGNTFPDGVYYMMSNDTIAPLDLLIGLLLYVDENGAWAKLVGDQITIGGNAANDSYQLFRSRLKALDVKMKELYAANQGFFRLLEAGDEDANLSSNLEVFDQYLVYLEEEQNIFYNYFSANLDTPLGEEVFLHYLESGTLDRFPAFDLNRLIEQSDNKSLRSNPRFTENIR